MTVAGAPAFKLIHSDAFNAGALDEWDLVGSGINYTSITTSKYVSAPSSVIVPDATVSNVYTAMCAKDSDCLDVVSGKINICLYQHIPPGLCNRILFRNQSSLGTVSTQNTFWIYFGGSYTLIEEHVAGLAYDDHQIAYILPDDEWVTIAVSWWVEMGYLKVALEIYESGAWIQKGTTWTTTGNRWATSGTNRVGLLLSGTETVALKNQSYADVFNVYETLTYPTDPTTRVSSIIHRYDRGIYNMEVGLGDVIAGSWIPGIDTTTVKSYTPKEAQQPYVSSVSLSREGVRTIRQVVEEVSPENQSIEATLLRDEIVRIADLAMAPGITSYARNVLVQRMLELKAKLGEL